MNLEDAVINIRKLYTIVSGKTECDVTLTYKGKEWGITKCWQARIDGREQVGKDHMEAVMLLFADLKTDLEKKVSFTEQQVASFKKVLSNFDN